MGNLPSRERERALEEEVKRAKEEAKRAKEEAKLAKKGHGTYFIRTENLWDPSEDSFGHIDIEKTFENRKTLQLEAYLQKCAPPPGDTEAEKHKLNLYSASRGSSDSKKYLKKLSSEAESNEEKKEGEITKIMNIFGTNTGSSIAHIVPKDLGCSIYFGPLGRVVSGLDANTPKERCYIVHGWKNDGNHCGIKNIPLNFLSLPKGHAKYFDGSNAGRLIIVPIVGYDAESGKFDWKAGDDYDAIVVAKDADTYRWIYGKDDEPVDLGVTEATPEEIELATSCLGQCVKVLAKMLTDQHANPLEDVRQLEPENLFSSLTRDDTGQLSVTSSTSPRPPSGRENQKSVLTREDSGKSSVASSASSRPTSGGERNLDSSSQLLANNMTTLQASKEKIKTFVRVPKLKSSVIKPVMKISLHNGGEASPDPLLLAFRAAVNWSVYTETRLLPCCHDELPEDELLDTIISASEAGGGSGDDISVLSSPDTMLTAAVVTPDSKCIK